MRDRIAICFSVLILSAVASAQLWSGIGKPTSGAGACSFGQITAAGQCMIDWTNAGIPGGIPTTWTQSGSTLTPSGGDDTAAINAALVTCVNASTGLPGHFVQLSGTNGSPATFNLSSATALTITASNSTHLGNCFINGGGPQATIINILHSGAHVQMGVFNDAPYKNGTCTITGGNTAGSATLTLSATGLDSNPCSGGTGVGGYLIISELNNPVFVTQASPQNATCGYCDGIWNGARLREQTVEMTSFSGAGPYTVGISPPLYTDYGVATGTSPAYATPMGAVNGGVPDCKYCGIQNLQIKANGYNLSSGTPDINMSLCAYCWIENVVANYTDADWLDMNWCYRCEVRNNYFFYAYGHGAGGSDADVSPRLATSGSLIVNNILQGGHGSLVVDQAAAGNVIAYNYSIGNFDGVASGTTLLDFVNHGAYPQFNLFEGNIGSVFDPDSWHGNNGYNIVYRNWFQGSSHISTYPPKAMTSGTCAAGTCTITWASGSSPFVTGQNVVINGTNVSQCGSGDTTTPWQWAVWTMTGANTFASGGCTSWTGGNAFTLDLAALTAPISHTGTGAVVATNDYNSYQAMWPLAVTAFSTGNSIIGNVLGADAMKTTAGSANLYNSGSGCTACMRPSTTRQYTQNSAALVSGGAKATTSSWGYDVANDSNGSVWASFLGGPSNTAGYWSTQGYVTTCYHENFDIASASTINSINCSPSTTLPASLFLSIKPTWWVNSFGAAPAWPAIGPDVTVGTDTATAGHASLIPAALAYNGMSRDSTGMKIFDANVVYAGLPQANTPVCTPPGGPYNSPQTVTCSDPGFTMYYTTDGSTPCVTGTGCPTGTLYSGPVTVSNSLTWTAVGGLTGYVDSNPVVNAYAINAPPQASLTPSALTFNPQMIGTPSPLQNATLQNTGGGSLIIASIAITGDFSQTHTCGSVLSPGSSCTIAVTFTPSTSGPRTGTLTVTDNSGGVGGSTQTVTLSGTGQVAPNPGITITRGVTITAGVTLQARAVVVGGPPLYPGLRTDTSVFQIGAIPNVWAFSGTTTPSLASYYADYGASGAGTSATNDGGITICRVTDANTDPAFHSFAYTTNYSGSDDDEHISIDASMFVFGRQAGSGHYLALVAGVNTCPVVVKIAGAPYIIPSKNVAFSQVTPGILYVMGATGAPSTTAIQKYDLRSCTPTSCSPTITLVYDPSAGTCLNGLNPSHNTVFRVNGDDTLFGTAYALTGGQNNDTLALELKCTAGGASCSGTGLGCRVWNTCAQAGNGSPTAPNNTCFLGATNYGYTPSGDTPTSLVTCTAPGCVANVIPASTIVGEWGSTGMMSVGLSPTYTPGATFSPEGFKIHETYQGYGTGAKAWVQMTIATCTAEDGTGSCTVDSPLQWLVSGTQSIAQSQGGHFGVGFASLVRGTNTPQTESALSQIVQPGNTLTTNLTANTFNVVSTSSPNNIPAVSGPFAPAAADTLDMHGSWNYWSPTDTTPILFGNTTSWQAAYTHSVPNTPNNGCAIPYPLWAATSTPPNCGTTNPFLGPFVDEELLTQTSNTPGAGSVCASAPCSVLPVIRPGNSYITGLSWQFSSANNIQSICPNGQCYVFNSDWEGTLGIKNGSTLPAIVGGLNWQNDSGAGHAYLAGDQITPVAGNASNYTYAANSNCTSGASAPTWIAGTVSEGTCTWNYLGIQNMRGDVFWGWLTLTH